jgi:hypothetical protein
MADEVGVREGTGGLPTPEFSENYARVRARVMGSYFGETACHRAR